MSNESKAVWSVAASKLGGMWCELTHDSPAWPIHGQYRCRVCGRHYPVRWSGTLLADNSKQPSPQMRPAPFRSASLSLFVVLPILLPVHADAGDRVVDPKDPAAVSFARYIAGLSSSSSWSLETIDIDASLPKLVKRGQWRAVRHLSPVGKPQYQVIDFVGDQTVKDQVIYRYLSAESKGADFPADSVAVTLANYKFSYNGAVKTEGGTAYSFSIKPRKKRVGLIKGELWLDGETGAVVRESGYLVKSPSIFIKRITVTRENVIRDGSDAERITHLSIDTRLVGQAELIIRERRGTDSDNISTLALSSARSIGVSPALDCR